MPSLPDRRFRFGSQDLNEIGPEIAGFSPARGDRQEFPPGCADAGYRSTPEPRAFAFFQLITARLAQLKTIPAPAPFRMGSFLR